MHDNHATVRINDISYTLHELERDCWKQLISAPARKQDGFKTLTLATRTLEDGVDARTVVLRQVDEKARTIWFHTDVRAKKILQLEAFPDAQLLFWDDKRQVQLRLITKTDVHIDDVLANAQWKNLWVGSRKMYLSAHVPGSEQAGPYPGFPESLGENLPSEAESEAGRTNFAAISCRILAMEYLHLSRSGQARARFMYEPELAFSWLAP
ncbi:MAG: pyridoxamine 5'-phosphate oxidase family protein [Bacteroidetes bacterium]|nr:pyridoxamine 5'-phosphate oxidase family protein [Fibrella sp.]